MNRLNPITPTLSLGRTTPSRTMFASHDAPGLHLAATCPPKSASHFRPSLSEIMCSTLTKSWR